MQLSVIDFRDYVEEVYQLEQSAFSVYTTGDPTILGKYIHMSIGSMHLSDILVPDTGYHSQEECFRLIMHQVKYELIRCIVDGKVDLKNALKIVFDVRVVGNNLLVTDKEDMIERLVRNGEEAYGCLAPKLFYTPERRMMEYYRGLFIINVTPVHYRHLETKINSLDTELVDIEIYQICSELDGTIDKTSNRYITGVTEGIISDNSTITEIPFVSTPAWFKLITNSLDVYENPTNAELSKLIPLIKSDNSYKGINLYINTLNCVYILMENCWVPSNYFWLMNNMGLIPQRISDELNIFRNMIKTTNG